MSNTLQLDVQTRLRAWSPLAGHERSSVSEHISETKAAIAAVEEQIQHLQLQRKDLYRRLASCKSLFAPIRSLPPDVLLEIFNLCSTIEIKYEDVEVDSEVDDSDDSSVPYKPATFGPWSRVTAPIAMLSQVCLTWNNLSISPAMWSNISLNLAVKRSKLDAYHISETKAALAGALARSGNHPLRVELRYQQPSDSENASHRYFQIMNTLFETCHRWRSADLVIHLNSPRAVDFAHLSNPMPHLHSLNICLESLWGTGNAGEPTWNGQFSNAPKLHHAVVNEKAFNVLHLPWHQLHSLTVKKEVYGRGTFLTHKRLGEVFAQCQTLHALTWDGDVYRDPYRRINDAQVEGEAELELSLPIKSLCVHNQSREGLCDAFKYPELTQIDIHRHANGNFYPLPTLRLTLRVLSLRVSLPDTSESKTWCIEDFWNKLGDFPALESLKIDQSGHLRCKEDNGEFRSNSSSANYISLFFSSSIFLRTEESSNSFSRITRKQSRSPPCAIRASRLVTQLPQVDSLFLSDSHFLQHILQESSSPKDLRILRIAYHILPATNRYRSCCILRFKACPLDIPRGQAKRTEPNVPQRIGLGETRSVQL